MHLKYFRSANLTARVKNPRDLVTIADTEAEKEILSLIKKHFPKDSILAEESGADIRLNDYLWIIDPLDGTSNFFKRQRDFCVLISLVSKNDTVFSITWFPLTKELFVAVKGKGATKNGIPLKVSKESNISKMYANTFMSSKLPARKETLKLYNKLLFKLRNIHVINACIARLLCDVAEGISDFHFKKGINIWDYAAGILLIQESGGIVTDLNGRKFDIKSTSILASNNKAHSKILKYIG